MGSLTLNQLLRIEEELGDAAVFFRAGRRFRARQLTLVLIQHKLSHRGRRDLIATVIRTGGAPGEPLVLTLNRHLRTEEQLSDEVVLPGWSSFRHALRLVLIQHKNVPLAAYTNRAMVSTSAG